MDSLNPILSRMETITLDQMSGVKLMNRVDEKFLMNRQQLAALLDLVVDEYYVQRIDGDALAPYNTLYFDTEDVAMYTEHHNRRLNRQKLRIRTYLSSVTTFMEVKNKNNKGKTKKVRIKVDKSIFYHALDDAQVREFLSEQSRYPLDLLMPHVENTFRRITLVDKAKTSRITIDSEIRFVNHHTGINYDLSPLVIMEVKHEVGAPLSAIQRAMLEVRVHPKRMSKYCIGTVLTNPQAKYNRFKQKIRYINDTISSSHT